MSELGVLGTAAVTVVCAVVGSVLGAAVAGSVSLVFVTAGLIVAMAFRRPIVVVVLIGVVSLSRSAAEEVRYNDALVMSPVAFDGEIRLVTDPELTGFGWRAEAALADGRRVRVSAHGGVGDALGRAEAGEGLAVTGSLRPTTVSPWLKSRHVVGSLSVSDARVTKPVPLLMAPSRWLRGAVADGAKLLPPRLQPLYLGLVIGDDREQTPAQQARFRAAGLTHLLAVSGQNVSFVLAVCSPLLSRLGGRARLVVTALVLVVFAIATRLEPSVMRATVTAGLAAWSVGLGRRARGVRSLSMAVAVLVVVDPFLVWSVGFQLSVGASLAIIVFGPAVTGCLPGPRPVAEAAGITIAAQVGVAPILLATFGPISLVTLPANVLAGWAAGLVMAWGMSVGVIAGVVAGMWGVGWLAVVAQRPAGWLVWWIDGVGTWAARVPLPEVGAFAGLALVAAAVVGRVAGGRWWVRVGLAASMVGAFVGAVPGAPDDGEVLVGGGTWFDGAGSAVLVLDRAADDRVVASLIDRRVGAIGVVIVTSPSRRAGRLANLIVDEFEVAVVLAPPLHRARDGTRVLAPLTIDVDAGSLEVAPREDGLVVHGP